VLGIYVAFQMVVLGALGQRMRGRRPAGPFSLGRLGCLVNVLALGVVVLIGLIYLVAVRPDRLSDAPEGDAIAVADEIHRRTRGLAARR